MPSEAEYRYCARTGMTQAECARHLGVSPAAVCYARDRYGLIFGMAWQFAPDGREMEMVFFRYPWQDFSVGDWIRTTANARIMACRATKRNEGKRFAARKMGCEQIVVRVA